MDRGRTAVGHVRRVCAGAMSVALVASLLWTPASATATDPLPVAPGHAKAGVGSTGSSAGVATQTTTQFATGDVFVAVGNGQIQWRHPDGSLNATLDTGLGGFTTGMAFDKPGTRLYSTAFSANTIVAFDASGAEIGTFGSGYNCSPESIAFNAAGDLYVGQADCAGDVVHLEGSGSPLGTHNVPVDRRGSDWVELAADQCTLYYTSEGTKVKRYNVCTDSAMADLSSAMSEAYALRITPDGQGVLVADTTSIKLIQNLVGGSIIHIYDAPDQNCWFALNLDPDGSSFWSADFCTSTVFKFDIETGTVLESFSTGTPANTVFGLVVYGEYGAARNRDCSSEDVSLGQVGADGDQVSVRYDPRYLVDESKGSFAEPVKPGETPRSWDY